MHDGGSSYAILVHNGVQFTGYRYRYSQLIQTSKATKDKIYHTFDRLFGTNGRGVTQPWIPTAQRSWTVKVSTLGVSSEDRLRVETARGSRCLRISTSWNTTCEPPPAVGSTSPYRDHEINNYKRIKNSAERNQ